jgi:hypothetical protein
MSSIDSLIGLIDDGYIFSLYTYNPMLWLCEINYMIYFGNMSGLFMHSYEARMADMARRLFKHQNSLFLCCLSQHESSRGGRGVRPLRSKGLDRDFVFS